MIADNFELEQPDDDEVVDDHECLMDITAKADTSTTTREEKDNDNNSCDNTNEYVEYHNILKKQNNRNDSEGTADTEQSLDYSTGTNHHHHDNHHHASKSQKEMKLVLTFVLMVVVGTGMKIFQKLQAIPYVTTYTHTYTHCCFTCFILTLQLYTFIVETHIYMLFCVETPIIYIRMYNYPSSLNLIQNFIYVPLCFMYIIPVSRLGLFNNSIPHEVTLMSKRPFVISEFRYVIMLL